MKNIEKIIENTNEDKESKINWTKKWGKRYPMLLKYQDKVNILDYSVELRKMLNSLNEKYGYNKLDSMLILKDILYREWKNNK